MSTVYIKHVLNIVFIFMCFYVYIYIVSIISLDAPGKNMIFCGAQFGSACVFLMPGSPSYSQLEVGDLILIQPRVVIFLEGTTISWRISLSKLK